MSILSSSGNNVLIWSLNTFECIHTIKNDFSVTYVIFSNNRKLFGYCCNNGSVFIYDLQFVKLHEFMIDVSTNSMNVIIFSPNDELVIINSDNGYLYSYSLQTKELVTMNAPLNYIWSPKLSSKKEIIVTCSNSGNIFVWSYKGELICVLKQHTDAVWCVDINYSETLLLSCSNDGLIVVWSLETMLLQYILIGHEDSVWCCKFKNNMIISLSRDNTIRLWSQSTQECIKIINIHFSYIIYNNLFNFEGNKIILCDNNNINIILLETDDRIILSGHTDNIVDMVFNSDETLLLSVSHDNTVRIWSMKTYECIGVLNHTDIINNISVYGMRYDDERLLKNILETITLPEISDIIISYTY